MAASENIEKSSISLKGEVMNAKLNLMMDPLVETLLDCPWEDKEFYCEYLAQSYHYVLYSTRMLAMAAALSTPAQQSYYRRCVKHISEEAAHEVLAIRDLAKLGKEMSDYPESGVTRALWEPQFYKIQRQPTALLGYILGLEYLTVRCFKELHARLVKTYGPGAVTFVRVHADEDPDHVEKAVAQIDPLSTDEQVEIWKNYEQTCRMFDCFLKEAALKSKQRSASSPTSNRSARLAG
jgi:hypothetical protein